MALQAPAAHSGLLPPAGHLLRNHHDRRPGAPAALARLAHRARGLVPGLHAAPRGLLHQRHQHLRRDQRHRGQPEPGDRLSGPDTQPDRKCHVGDDDNLQRPHIPTAPGQLFPAAALSPQHPRPDQVQQVPVPGLRRRHLLLLRRDDLRRGRDFGPLLEDAAFVFHPTNLQLPHFTAAAVRGFRVPEAPAAEVYKQRGQA